MHRSSRATNREFRADVRRLLERLGRLCRVCVGRPRHLWRLGPRRASKVGDFSSRDTRRVRPALSGCAQGQPAALSVAAPTREQHQRHRRQTLEGQPFARTVALVAGRHTVGRSARSPSARSLAGGTSGSHTRPVTWRGVARGASGTDTDSRARGCTGARRASSAPRHRRFCFDSCSTATPGSRSYR